MNTGQLFSVQYKRQFLGLLVLALFFITHNISSVFYQIRGVNETHYQGSLAGYFLGILLCALALPGIQRGFVRKRGGTIATLLAPAGLFAATVLPALVSLVTPFLLAEGYAGTAFINTLQPGLWSMQLPLALYLFFLHTRQSRYAYYFCLSLCAGHLCWSLLIPLAQPGTFGGAADFIENRYLPFLNVARALTSTAFAWLTFKLMRERPRTERPADPCASPADTASGRMGLLYLLIPLLLCFFYNGVQGYLYFPRLITRGLYAEYLHLVLAVLFPLLGILMRNGGLRPPPLEGPALDERQQRVLRRVMFAAALCFALTPVLLVRVPHKAAFQTMYFVCAVSLQTLLMAGTLACGRYAVRSRRPALIAVAAWLSSSAAIAGNITANRIFPALPVSSYQAIVALCAACVASLFFWRKAFPLPAPIVQEYAVPEAAVAHALSGSPPDADQTPGGLEQRMKNYADAHKLSKREREILGLLIEGRGTEEIADVLGLKIASVRHYIYTLLKKTGAGNRLALVSSVMGNIKKNELPQKNSSADQPE